MGFAVGQKVTFSPLGTGRKENATIVERGVDYPNGYISTPNDKGNFDYVITIFRNGKIEYIFCKENELK